MNDRLSEKCGIFGVYGKGLDVSRLSFYGLFSLQHRGQESSGIATSDGVRIRSHKNVGLVTQVYSEELINDLTGHIAIGHNRYSTSKDTGILHAQPVIIDDILAFAHNGNLPSVAKLAAFLEKNGINASELNDSEMMAHAIAWHLTQGRSLKDAIAESFPLFTGAFSFVAMTKNALAVVRDTTGVKPLSMGRLNGGLIFASETCAFRTIGASFLRDIEPGEMVVISDDGFESIQIARGDLRLEIFEFVYFARPDSDLIGKSVYHVRHNFGKRLARETHLSADIVVPVPETAIPVALGYSQATGMPMEMALVKNRYIHRTFIQPEQHTRDLGVKLKLTPLPDVLKNKRVVLIDDSIVRGTTSRQIIRSLFEAGATEVHFLISSPPIKFPDFYGIDTPNQSKLLAASKNNEEIRQFIEATSLHYLSLNGLVESTETDRACFNLSCFTGEYPIDLGERYAEISPPKIAPEKLTPQLGL